MLNIKCVETASCRFHKINIKQYLIFAILTSTMCLTACSSSSSGTTVAATATTATIAETETTSVESQQSGDTETDTANANTGDFIWDITVTNYEISDGLHTVVPVTQYDRSVMDVAYDNVPSSGNVFVLLELDVTKQKAGNAAFSWDDVSLVDNDGQTYTRMDDIFLQDHGYARMNGTDLKLGSYTGWICFEIPVAQSSDALTLEYSSDSGTQSVSIQYSP